MESVRGRLLVAFALLTLIAAGCSSKSGQKKVTATFTPEPRTLLAAGGTVPPRPAQPVVNATCLQGLSAYRFAGTLAFKAAPTASGSSDTTSAGSLANLLSNVSFNGAAQAPDRTQATVTFGGNGTQPLQVVRIGAQTFSRFGNSAWQQGDQIAGLGNIVQFDPEALCESSLIRLDATGQTPVHETVNGVPSLRYHFSGPSVARSIFGADSESSGAGPNATPTPQAGDFDLTVWAAEQGGYPVRMQTAGSGQGSVFNLLLNVTDLNGKDIKIESPR
ncbi:MAG: hypothetical protein ACR2PL_02665 [Dehalococcoidia bacterium]